MTHAEFAKGWGLLITQPRGWRYSGMSDNGQMTQESKTQLEFYYAKLKWAEGAAWIDVAERFAEGDKWPSIQELRLALQHVNSRYVKALPQPQQEFCSMPDAVRERLSRFVGKDL